MSEVFTAMLSSIGSSGGITEVMMSTHDRKSLYVLRRASFMPSFST